MPLNIDQKLIVTAAIAVPVLYQFLDWDFSIWILIAIAAYGYHTLDNNFINKADYTEKREIRQLGNQQPFLPPSKEWGIDPATGTPIPPRYQPPMQYPQQPYPER